jgi:hypothetical protein
MSHLRAAAPATKEGDRGRVSLAKVPRYWAGKRSEGAELKQEEDAAAATSTSALFSSQREDADVKRTPVAAAVIVKHADPRLARLAKTDVEDARGEGRQRHRWARLPALMDRQTTMHACIGAQWLTRQLEHEHSLAEPSHVEPLVQAGAAGG